jgi:hypothetical protein
MIGKNAGGIDRFGSDIVALLVCCQASVFQRGFLL